MISRFAKMALSRASIKGWGREKGWNTGERLVNQELLRPQLTEILDALTITMFPEGGAIPYSAEDVELTAYILDLLAKLDETKANALCVLLLIYEHVLPLIFLKGNRFTKLSAKAQFDILERLHESSIYPLRLLNTSLRMLFTFGYMADERVLKDMGFFKKHEYPSDPRLIEILESLPWESEKQVSKQKDEPTEQSVDSSLLEEGE